MKEGDGSEWNKGSGQEAGELWRAWPCLAHKPWYSVFVSAATIDAFLGNYDCVLAWRLRVRRLEAVGKCTTCSRLLKQRGAFVGSSSWETWWKIHQPLCWSMGIDTPWEPGSPEQDGTNRGPQQDLGLTQRSPRGPSSSLLLSLFPRLVMSNVPISTPFWVVSISNRLMLQCPWTFLTMPSSP